jgi:hypothetical protein
VICPDCGAELVNDRSVRCTDGEHADAEGNRVGKVVVGRAESTIVVKLPR